jgi:hypothetical protein
MVALTILFSFPSSLLRIVSNYELLHVAGGLLDFLETDPHWLHKYTALLLTRALLCDVACTWSLTSVFAI